ncbi:MAG: hypothetical protein WB869_00650 [Candidatus Acidiferrales bacterium]
MALAIGRSSSRIRQSPLYVLLLGPQPISLGADSGDVEKAGMIVALTTGFSLVKHHGAAGYASKFGEQDKIVLAAAGLLGYFGGRWISLQVKPSCSDKAILAKLSDANYWNQLLHESVRNACNSARVDVHGSPAYFVARLDGIKSLFPHYPGVRPDVDGWLFSYKRANDDKSVITEDVVAG